MIRTIAVAAVVLTLAACGSSGAQAAQERAQPWDYNPDTKVYTMCTEYGDRLYALNGGLAVVPGACRGR